MKTSYLSDSMKIFAHRTHWGAIEIRLGCLGMPDQKPMAARPVEFASCAEGDFVEPAMVLGPTEAQQLMDELWRAGVRPAEGDSSVGQLGATEKHLADMRAIAFHKLGIAATGK
jgi:hypothetical protein